MVRGERLYSSSDFAILNELGVPCWFTDLTPTSMRFVWANRAALDEVFKMSFEKMMGLDLMKGATESTNRMRKVVWETVQNKKQSYKAPMTIYPDGQPTSILVRYEPCQIVLPATHPDAGKHRVVLFASLISQSSDTEDTSEQRYWKGQNELLKTSNVMSTMFDMSSGSDSLECAQVQSIMAEDYYMKLGYGPASCNGSDAQMKILRLADFLDTCIFDDVDTKASLLAQIRKMQIDSKAVQFTCRKLPVDGDDFPWHDISIVSAQNPLSDKHSFAIVANEYDVTRERAIKDILARSEKAKDDLKDFLSAASHELRTPLNGIIGLSESLLESGDCSSFVSKSLSVIKDCGRRLAGLVDTIIDEVSAKRGQITLQWELLNFHEVAEAACDAMRPSLGQARLLQIHNHIPERMAPVHADFSRMKQVLLNLIGNAVKFTEQGDITVSAHGEGEELRVSVADTGCGIPHEHWDEVWLPFRQLDMSSTRKHGGTGLGLSLVKELVEAHGGKVGVESDVEGPDRGSTFFFTLPLKPPRSASASLSPSRSDDDSAMPPPNRSSARQGGQQGGQQGGGMPASPPAATSGLRRPGSVQSLTSLERHQLSSPPAVTPPKPQHDPGTCEAEGGVEGEGEAGGLSRHNEIYGGWEVLSIDDNPVNHMVVKSALKPRGYKVTECLSGEAALALIAKRRFLPDCALVDQCMPEGISGHQTCQELRKRYGLALPLIMVSANAREEDVKEAIDAGASEYLCKPYSVADLNGRIDTALRLRRHWLAQAVQLLVARASRVELPEAILTKMAEGEVEGGGDVHHEHGMVVAVVCGLEGMERSARRLAPHTFHTLHTELLDEWDSIAREEGAQTAIDDCYVVVVGAWGAAKGPEEDVAVAVRIAERMLAKAETLRGEGVKVRMGVARGPAASALVGVRAGYFTFFGPALWDAWEVGQMGGEGCIVLGAELARVPAVAARTQPCRFEHRRLGALCVVTAGQYKRCIPGGEGEEEGAKVEEEEEEDEEEEGEVFEGPVWGCTARGLVAAQLHRKQQQQQQQQQQGAPSPHVTPPPPSTPLSLHAARAVRCVASRRFGCQCAGRGGRAWAEALRAPSRPRPSAPLARALAGADGASGGAGRASRGGQGARGGGTPAAAHLERVQQLEAQVGELRQKLADKEAGAEADTEHHHHPANAPPANPTPCNVCVTSRGKEAVARGREAEARRRQAELQEEVGALREELAAAEEDHRTLAEERQRLRTALQAQEKLLQGQGQHHDSNATTTTTTNNNNSNNNTDNKQQQQQPAQESPQQQQQAQPPPPPPHPHPHQPQPDASPHTASASPPLLPPQASAACPPQHAAAAQDQHASPESRLPVRGGRRWGAGGGAGVAIQRHLLQQVELQAAEMRQREALYRQERIHREGLTRSILLDMASMAAPPLLRAPPPNDVSPPANGHGVHS